MYEILDNAIDEIQGGHATNVRVELDLDSGWVSISDDGRGIPTSTHPATGKSALETVLTVLHAGGKFGGQGSGYSVSAGCTAWAYLSSTRSQSSYMPPSGARPCLPRSCM